MPHNQQAGNSIFGKQRKTQRERAREKGRGFPSLNQDLGSFPVNEVAAPRSPPPPTFTSFTNGQPSPTLWLLLLLPTAIHKPRSWQGAVISLTNTSRGPYFSIRTPLSRQSWCFVPLGCCHRFLTKTTTTTLLTLCCRPTLRIAVTHLSLVVYVVARASTDGLLLFLASRRSLRYCEPIHASLSTVNNLNHKLRIGINLGEP